MLLFGNGRDAFVTVAAKTEQNRCKSVALKCNSVLISLLLVHPSECDLICQEARLFMYGVVYHANLL